VLEGARLTNAELDSANFGKADLTQANLAHADLNEAYLGGTKLIRADLRGANLQGTNLEESSLVEANLDGADLTGALASGADFSQASMLHANLTGAFLKGARFERADMRRAILVEANLVGASFASAKLYAVTAANAVLAGVRLETIDASLAADGSRILSGADALAFLTGGAPEPVSTTRRYFGKGDVLRNASLEFHAGSVVVIESHFDNCAVTLGERTELVIGPPGVLTNCRVSGPGLITVHGQIFEGDAPGVVGPLRFVVSSEGRVVSTIEQHPQKTAFGIEPGARLRARITTPKANGA